MQSAVPHVLQVLERTHDPARVPQAVAWARAAGFEQVSLDLIYGTPGETVAGLAGLGRRRAGLRARPRVGVLTDRGGRHSPRPSGAHRRHPRTRRRRPRREVRDRRRRVHRGRAATGTRSPTGPATRPRAVATTSSTGRATTGGASVPGAHSHVAGERWWNVKHPSAYAARIAAGESPAQDGEVLDDESRRLERVLLEIRLRDGLPLDLVTRHAPRTSSPRAGRARAGPPRAHPEGPPARRRGGPRPRRLNRPRLRT